MDYADVHRACRQGDLERLREVLKHVPGEVNQLDKKLGWSPLYRAVICNQYQVAKLLLEHQADPNFLTRLGESPLHQAADSGLEDLTKLLLAHQADPDLPQRGNTYTDGDTPLHRAAEKGRERIVQLLLNAGADINTRNTSVCAI